MERTKNSIVKEVSYMYNKLAFLLNHFSEQDIVQRVLSRTLITVGSTKRFSLIYGERQYDVCLRKPMFQF